MSLFAQPSLKEEPRQGLSTQKNLTQFILTIWNTEDGLPSNTVNSLIQDELGYIWISGYDGLVRFDGVNFKTYSASNFDKFNTNSFTDFFNGNDGELWIGSVGNGLVRQKGNKITTIADTLSVRIETIYQDKTGKVWIGTRGKGIYIYEDSTLKTWNSPNINLSKSVIKKIVGTEDGYVYIGVMGKGLLEIAPDNSQTLFTIDNGLPANDVSELHHTYQGLLIGTTKGVSRLNNGKITSLPIAEGEFINAIYQDKLGSIWIGLGNGLLRYTPEGKVQKLDTEGGLPHQIVKEITQDKEGNIWLATYKGGIAQLKDGKFNNYSQVDGLPSNVINSLIWKDNSVVVGTDKTQIARINNQNVSLLPNINNLTSRVKTLLKSQDGSLWIGTDTKVICYNEKDDDVIFSSEDNLTGRVRYLYENYDGNIWVGTRSAGIIILTPNGEVISYKNQSTGFPSDFIMSIKKGKDKDIWVGTNNAGLIRISSKGEETYFNVQNGLLSSLVFSTYTDDEGITWVCTNSGLSKIYTDKKISNFTTKDGLPQNSIFDVLEDDLGNLWFTTSKGVFAIAKKDFSRLENSEIENLPYRLFDQSDGMKSEQCSGAVFSLKTPDGKLWFPTLGGVAVMNPERVAINDIAPKVHINSFEVDSREFDLSSGNIELEAGSNRITFSFSGLSYVAPKEIKFFYQLIPLDKDWVLVEGERKATYTNLPNGKYTFQVKAINEDGIETKSPAEVQFTINPFFYQRTIFRVLAIILVLLLGYAIYRWRVRSIQRKNERLEKTVEERTAEINQQKEEIQVQHEKLAASYRDIELVGQIGQEVTSELELKTLIKTVYKHVENLMPTDGFGIGIYDRQRNLLDFKYYIEKGELQPASTDSMTEDAHLSVQAAKSKEEIVINNLSEQYEEYAKLKKLREEELSESTIYLPLLIEDKLLGVLTVQSYQKNAYTSKDVTILRALASYIAVALSNARSYSTIREKNRQITDSIRYAQTIQHAVLPSQTNLDELFEKYFVLYRPKDVVSGDFYWYGQSDEHIFLCVADCTGHGVPGAFMAMIGISMLNDLVSVQDIHDTSLIVELLNQKVKEALKQQEAKNSDGMDLVLCRVDKVSTEKGRRVDFVGAKNSIFYTQNGRVERLRGSRRSVGGKSRNDAPFETHTFYLNEGDKIYLMSDGYIDQHSEKGIKVGTKHLLTLLEDIQDQNIKEQAKTLENYLDNFQGAQLQRDDITLWAIEF